LSDFLLWSCFLAGADSDKPGTVSNNSAAVPAASSLFKETSFDTLFIGRLIDQAQTHVAASIPNQLREAIAAAAVRRPSRPGIGHA
jgi:hypothetical protein